jgi:hypothetical protein
MDEGEVEVDDEMSSLSSDGDDERLEYALGACAGSATSGASTLHVSKAVVS